MKRPIVIVISGGTLQAVYASEFVADELEVELVDHDDMEAEGVSRDEREQIEDKAVEGLTELPISDFAK